jgi:hypothetical protein
VWEEPIGKSINYRTEVGCKALYNIYLDYLDYHNFLAIIQERLTEDRKSYRAFADQHHKLLDRIMIQFEGNQCRLTSSEQQEIQNMDYWQTRLMLDTESFFMFARILMDKLVKLAVCLLNCINISIPTKSFTDHKEWLLKPSNIPFGPNENYAKIVRDQTSWYDLAITGIRDKVIVHGNARMRIISYPDQKITKAVRISSFNEENDQIILIKKAYEKNYPELKNINSLWEVLRFFLDQNVNLSKEDRSKVNGIIEKTGCELPDIDLVVKKIIQFLKQFSEAFRGYPLK